MALDLNLFPSLPAKNVFIIHFMLITWGVQGIWSPDSYLFYNIIFLGSLILAMQNTENEKSAQLAISVNLVTILLDIITILFYFPNIYRFTEVLSLFCAVGNSILRLATLSILSRMCIDSSNGVSDGIPAPLQNYISRGTSNPQSYEDIEQPPQQPGGNAPFFTPYR